MASRPRVVLVSATYPAFLRFLAAASLTAGTFSRLRDCGNSFIADGVWYRRVHLWTQAQGYDRSTTTCMLLPACNMTEYDLFSRLKERYAVEGSSDEDVYVLLPSVAQGSPRIKQCTYCGSFTAEGHPVKHYESCTRPRG